MATAPPPPAESIASIRQDLERDRCSLTAAMDRLAPLLTDLPALGSDEAGRLAAVLIAKASTAGPRAAAAAQALDAAVICCGVEGAPHIAPEPHECEALAAAVCRAARRGAARSCRDAFVAGADVARQGGRAADRLAADADVVARAAAVCGAAQTDVVAAPEKTQRRRLGPARGTKAGPPKVPPSEALAALDIVKVLARHAPDALLRRWPDLLPTQRTGARGPLVALTASPAPVLRKAAYACLAALVRGPTGVRVVCGAEAASPSKYAGRGFGPSVRDAIGALFDVCRERLVVDDDESVGGVGALCAALCANAAPVDAPSEASLRATLQRLFATARDAKRSAAVKRGCWAALKSAAPAKAPATRRVVEALVKEGFGRDLLQSIPRGHAAAVDVVARLWSTHPAHMQAIDAVFVVRPALVHALHDAATRKSCFDILESIFTQSDVAYASACLPNVFESLAPLVRDTSNAVRQAACRAAAACLDKEGGSVLGLLAALRGLIRGERDADVTAAACRALGVACHKIVAKREAGAICAALGLRASSQDDCVAVRAQAAFALGSVAKALVDAKDSQAVATDHALRILAAPETRVRASALRAAGYLVVLRGFDKAPMLADALVDACADALTSRESGTRQAPPKIRRNACIALAVCVAAPGKNATRRQCLELLVDALRIFASAGDDDQDRKALARAAAALSAAVPRQCSPNDALVGEALRGALAGLVRCDGEGAFPSAGKSVSVRENGPRVGDAQQRRADLFRALGDLARALLAHGAASQLRAADLGARLDFAYVWLSRADVAADLFDKVAAALEAPPALAPAAALERCRARARLLRSRATESDDEDEL